MRSPAVVLVGLVCVLLTGCGGDARPDPEPVAPPPVADEAEPVPTLRQELLRMMRDDQAERTGEGLPPGTRLPPAQDYPRMVRLQEIIRASGWPTYSTVGKRGVTAAWVVAQHADFDVRFQARALRLMRAAVADGEADATEAAYLADRVAVNRGRPQRFGSQVRCDGGEPRPATPIEPPSGVDRRRLAVGMERLADYHADLAMMCAQEAAAGQQAGP